MNRTKVQIDILISAPDKEESISLVGQEFIFGRSPNSSVYLNDPGFSRSHFKLFLQNNSVWIADLGSSNGTFLNGERLESEREVALDDIVRIMNSSIEIKIIDFKFDDSEGELSEEYPEGLDLSSLSEQIISAANLKVEQIIQAANEKSSEIIKTAKLDSERLRADALHVSEKSISEKQKKAEATLEQYKIEHKAAIEKELALEKKKKAEEIESHFLNDKAKMQKKLEDEASAIALENEKKKNDLIKGLKQFDDQMSAKKEDYAKLEIQFEERLKKTNDELDLKVLAKKEEISKLEANYKEEKRKHSETIEREAKERQSELQQVINDYELKIKTKQKEIEKLEAEASKEKDRLLVQVEQDIEVRKNELQFMLNEVESKINSKKQEITKLEIAHENQKNKQFQMLEAQMENKRFELNEQLAEYEAKVAASEKEFSSLFERYESKKNDQISDLQKLGNLKEKTEEEIKHLEIELITHKKKNEEQLRNDHSVLSVLHQEIEKFKGIKHDLEVACNKMNHEHNELQKVLTEIKKITANEEEAIKQKRATLQTIEAEIKKMTAQKEVIVPKLATLNNDLIALTKKVEAASLISANSQSEHAKEVASLKANFLQNKANLEEEMRKLKEAEEKRLQDLTRQELNQINKIKEDSLRLVLDLENSITKELSNSTSKVFATTIGVAKFREIAPDYEKSVRASLQAGVLKLLQNELTPSEARKGKSLSTNQKVWKPVTLGVVASALVFGLLPYIYRQVQDQNDPIKQQLEAQARAAAVVPIKKFTPTKVATLGSTFVNSVIYTEEFCEIYAQEKFRSELMKKGSAYLYKQWQINEEKSIESYAIIFSLIDTLKAKTEKIDPDYEKRDIDKMVAIEKETMKKLEKILGNEVRLEAALKFQTRYYQEFVAQRGIASGAKE